MSPKNKIGVYYNNKKREYINGATHDARTKSLNHDVLLPVLGQPGPVVVAGEQQVPARGRLLAPSGNLGQQARRLRAIVDPLAVGVTDNNPQTLVPNYTQIIQNYHGRVGATDTGSHNPNYRGNFAASYVTGSHAFKAGFDLNGAFRWALNQSVVPYSYVVSTLANNGVGAGIPVPVSLTLRSDGCTDPLSAQVNGRVVGGNTSIQPGCPTDAAGSPNRVKTEGGVFVQDKWTMNRLTVSVGFRIDWFDSQNPAFHLYPSLLTPNRNYDVPEFSTTRYRDWTPKVGVAYDLFGDGKTAIKANVGRVRSRSGAGPRRTRKPARLHRPADLVARLGRQQQELHPGLRPDESGDQGPTQTGANNQVDTCNAAGRSERQLLQQHADSQPRGAGRCPLRLGQAAVQLGVLGQRAARDWPRHLGQRRRLQALVRQLPRHRRYAATRPPISRRTASLRP